MFTHTDLTEAAENAGVTADQARTLLEAAGVTVQPEKPTLPTEPGSVIIATEVRGVEGERLAFLAPGGQWATSERIDGYVWHHPDLITAWTEAVVVPAGKKIDPKGDVREGDRVRLVLNNGAESTFTVDSVSVNWIDSYHNSYHREIIHALYLLD